MQQVSDNLYCFTREWEDFSPIPYYATKKEKAAGKQTIGFGHVILPGERFTSISREQAMILLKHDMAQAIAITGAAAHPSLSQCQFEAMCDLVFNVGPKAIAPGTGTGAALRAGDISTLRIKLPQFRMQGGEVLQGLVRRATGRLALFDGKPWDEAVRIGRAA